MVITFYLRSVSSESRNLFIFQVGDLTESNVYIGKKVKACENVGIKAQHVRLAKTATQSQVRLNICNLVIKAELSSCLLSDLGYIMYCWRFCVNSQHPVADLVSGNAIRAYPLCFLSVTSRLYL